MNMHRLIADLREQIDSRSGATQTKRVNLLVEAAMDGEFDGTAEEAEAWGESAEGREVFRELLGGE